VKKVRGGYLRQSGHGGRRGEIGTTRAKAIRCCLKDPRKLGDQTRERND